MLASTGQERVELASQSEIEATLLKFHAFLDDQQDGETSGVVYSITDDGNRTVKGKFRVARAANQKVLFEYENDFKIAVAGNGRTCDYKTFRGIVKRNQDLDATLSAVSGITKGASLVVASVFSAGPRHEELKKSITSSTFREYKHFGNQLCAVFRVERSSYRLDYAVNPTTGSLVAIERKSKIFARRNRILYEVHDFLPKVIADDEFRITLE